MWIFFPSKSKTMRSETRALQWILPRLVEMVTQSVLSTPSRRPLGTDLAEELGLQLGEPGDPAAHRPARVVLGEAVGRYHVGIPRVLRRVVGVVGTVEELCRRVSPPLVEQVRDRRLHRLVVDRGGPSLRPTGANSQPSPSPCMMNGPSPGIASTPLASASGR